MPPAVLFIGADCNALIATVTGSGANPINGNSTAKVWVEGTQPASYVKRHYEITPASNAATATGTVTLYFTQQEFTDYNALNIIKLPADAADLDNNKLNLRIEKRSGTSSNGSGLPESYYRSSSGNYSRIGKLECHQFPLGSGAECNRFQWLFCKNGFLYAALESP